ncbi:hypothetical protein ACHAXA_003579 [Cyclostephanos tholiformis]|uniref:ATP-dependent RNA helicase n=1 Tax=Cyclostephanos tholiformis TaxID=382380 RepID=A0ABD3RST1_9STRA
MSPPSIAIRRIIVAPSHRGATWKKYATARRSTIDATSIVVAASRRSWRSYPSHPSHPSIVAWSSSSTSISTSTSSTTTTTTTTTALSPRSSHPRRRHHVPSRGRCDPLASRSPRRRRAQHAAYSSYASALPVKYRDDDDVGRDDDDDNDDDDDVIDGMSRFDSLSGLHPSSLHAVSRKMGLIHMTEVQLKTFGACRSGRDVLARARTGTGKTLAFLLPAIESALGMGRVPGPHDANVDGGGGGCGDGDGDGGNVGRAGIAILVLSPTRELAMQIHAQAQVLTSSHSNGIDGLGRYPMKSQVMYGGTSRAADLRKLEDNPPFILVATPGRLIDHIRTSRVRRSSFADVIRGVSVWVLDEADRCLDMGFRNDMEYILRHKSRGGRGGGEEDRNDVLLPAQTLLFSATLPGELRSIMSSHMREDYLTVDCVMDVDPATHTNSNVDQTYVMLPSSLGNVDVGVGRACRNEDGHVITSRFISGLVDIVEDVIHVRNPSDYKIVVFFPTTAMCEFFSHVFNSVYRIPVLEIHSRKNQNNRTTTSDKFRKYDRGILFTTDVSARGVDYPNVTHVIQFGSAENRETYIHRLGRTGRAGKVGRGIIICVTPGEERQFVKRELGGLDVRLDGRYQRLLNGEVVIEEGETGGGGVKGFLMRREINAARLRKILNGIGNGDDEVLQRMGKSVYRSLLGYNMTKMSNLGMTRKEEVVAHVNSMAMQMGYGEGRMPRLSPKIVQALGLVGVRGVNVGRDSSDYEDDGGGVRGFHGRGAGGGGSAGGRFGERVGGGGGGGGRGGRGRGGRGNYDESHGRAGGGGGMVVGSFR